MSRLIVTRGIAASWRYLLVATFTRFLLARTPTRLKMVLVAFLTEGFLVFSMATVRTTSFVLVIKSA